MIIYDIETKRAILGRNEERHPDIEYCAGWDDFKGMGIAVVGVYDFIVGRSRTYLEDNLKEFQRIINVHDVVVGFNNKRFDDRVLAANGVNIDDGKSYDLLREIWRGSGVLDIYDRNGFQSCHKGYSLDAMAKANLGIAKTGNGADAPLKWQRGEFGAVIDYCHADVAITQKLLQRVLDKGFLIHPNGKESIPVRRPNAEA